MGLPAQAVPGRTVAHCKFGHSGFYGIAATGRALWWTHQRKHGKHAAVRELPRAVVEQDSRANDQVSATKIGRAA
jgi:hypothetical protein